MSGDLLRTIRAMHQASEACVRVDGEMTEWFEVRQGVRQGCPMSPCGLSRYGGPKSTSQFQGGVTLDTCKVHRYCCLQMTQFWLQIIGRTSKTTSQRSKKQ